MKIGSYDLNDPRSFSKSTSGVLGCLAGQEAARCSADDVAGSSPTARRLGRYHYNDESAFHHSYVA